MSSAPFTVGIRLNSASSGSAASEWVADLFLPSTGAGFAYQVTAGDVLFLDTRTSTTAPNTVSRYLVKATTTVRETWDNYLSATLSWASPGDPVDPNEVAGYSGYISRPSSRNKLVWHPTAADVGVDEAVIQGARNAEAFAVLDNLAARDGARQVRTMAPDGGPYATGDVVMLQASGLFRKASPGEAAYMPAVGVVVSGPDSDNRYEVQFGGALDLPSRSFTPGKFVWVGPLGLTQNMGEIPSNGVLQQAGIALSPTAVALAFPGLTATK